jgi:hypothetical protein
MQDLIAVIKVGAMSVDRKEAKIFWIQIVRFLNELIQNVGRFVGDILQNAGGSEAHERPGGDHLVEEWPPELNVDGTGARLFAKFREIALGDLKMKLLLLREIREPGAKIRFVASGRMIRNGEEVPVDASCEVILHGEKSFVAILGQSAGSAGVLQYGPEQTLRFGYRFQNFLHAAPSPSSLFTDEFHR